MALMIDESFRNLLTSHSEKRRNLEKSLETLPFGTTSFSPESLNKIILIKKDLGKVVNNLNIEDALSASIGYLDSHKWAARFTTGEPGKRNPDSDSLYYMTPEGASLRLKINNKQHGDINRVIQPFFEKIFFEDITDSENRISFEPHPGLTAHEFVSPEFLAIQRGDAMNDRFESKIRVYTKNNVPHYVQNVPDGHFHTSSTINFTR